MSESESKRCSRCREIKPLSEFYKNRSRKDGHHHRCRLCGEADRQDLKRKDPARYKLYQRNTDSRRKEQKAEYFKERYPDIRDERLAQNKEWREDNTQHLAEYRAANRERKAMRQREYVKANRERINELARINAATRRARKKAANGSHTMDDVMELLESQDYLCAYCESEVGDGYQVDHMVPLSRGGSNDWSNLAIACRLCNQRKNSLTPEEFMNRQLG